jgi:DNA-directed RNA polymerase subunit RPC12/RpoP
MQALALEGQLGTAVPAGLCAACRVLWFGHLKELQLAPAGTLRLFGVIASTPSAGPALADVLRCPECRARLILTHDMQRATRFQYWRCEAGHGRLMSFADFLREKDFVRPLTPSEIADLRTRIQVVACDHCGAPIDLTKDSACAHCGSPVSFLDPAQTSRTIAQLQNAAAGRRPDDGAPAAAAPPSPDMKALMQMILSESRAGGSQRLLDAGFRVLGELLKPR